MRILISIILLFITLTGCASYAKKELTEKNIVHIVLIWLHEPGNIEHIEKITKMSRKLKDISEIQELRVGRAVLSDREIVDDSFDVGLYMIFSSQEDMQRYLIHPKHKQAVQNSLRPLASKIVVYDFYDMN